MWAAKDSGECWQHLGAVFVPRDGCQPIEARRASEDWTVNRPTVRVSEFDRVAVTCELPGRGAQRNPRFLGRKDGFSRVAAAHGYGPGCAS